MDYALPVIAIGAGATAVMDVWTAIRHKLLGVAAPDYGLVGRWLAHMMRGRFRHDRITNAEPARGERWIGWIAHYVIGVAFAAMLIFSWGLDWTRHPTIGPALIVGIGSVAAPLLLMQLGMGAGIAASRTPNPAAARLQSLMTHTVFGFGLYAAGRVVSLFLR